MPAEPAGESRIIVSVATLNVGGIFIPRLVGLCNCCPERQDADAGERIWGAEVTWDEIFDVCGNGGSYTFAHFSVSIEHSNANE